MYSDLVFGSPLMSQIELRPNLYGRAALPTRSIILTVFVSECHDSIKLIRVVHDTGGEISDVDSDVRAFFDFELDALVLAQEITDLFIVDFEVGHSNQESGNSLI